MNFIACLRHPDQNISFIYLLPNQIELLCENCVDDNEVHGELLKINKLISINTLLQKPETIFKKIEFGEKNQITYSKIFNYNPSTINAKVLQIEKQIQTLQQLIKDHLQTLKNCIQNIENEIKQFQKDYIQRFDFNQLKQLLMGLVQSDDANNPDAIEQLKQKLHQCFSQLQMDNEKNAEIFYNLFQTSYNVNFQISNLQDINQLKSMLEQLQKDKCQIATSIFPPLQLNLFTQKQLYKTINLVKERSKCEISEIKSIYLGSRDGLNAQSFWAKVNGKENLLMIFKSKSNYIFGGYSPCQWQQNLGNYAQDNTNSSFLFSQTHDEIYPLVNSQYAIFCTSSYGPRIGGGHDICINGDFQGGYSNLGHSYKWDKYQNQKSTHLFGQEIPNIIECEIIEVQFK